MADEKPVEGGIDIGIVPLLEEVALVESRRIETGRVCITTHTDVTEEIAKADLQTDAVEVTHVPIGRPVTGSLPQIRVEGDVTIIPVFEEILVVEKRLVLKEEVHVRKRSTTETVALPISLRHQAAVVERLEPAQTGESDAERARSLREPPGAAD